MERRHIHVVVMTRINIYLFKERALEDRDRLSRRLDLFERWTVPSVRWQTAPPDLWLILMDEGTHPDDLARVRAAVVGLQARVVLFPAEYDRAHFMRLMSTAMSANRPWLMTCRLDSDDAIGKDFLRTMVNSANPTIGEFLNAGTGYKVAGIRLCEVQDPSSPFLSYLEPAGENVLTALHLPHHLAGESGLVRQIDGNARWLMTVHSLNMETTMTGEPRRLRDLYEQFPYPARSLVLNAMKVEIRQRTTDRSFVKALRRRRRTTGGLW
jgi:hypothetical protein